MDFSDNSSIVSREPILVNAYDKFYQFGWGGNLPGNDYLLMKFSIPDDGYQYTLVECDWFVSYFSGSNAQPGPCQCNIGFSLDRNPETWIWITGGWFEHSVRHRPSGLGSLSLMYPSVYCSYMRNTSSKSILAWTILDLYQMVPGS